MKTKEANITKAPSQGKIEQKFQIFPLTKALCYLFDTNRTYEIKVNFRSDKINLSFFSLFSKQMCSYRK